ncbi:MAG: glutamate--cysteine ligase [Pseudonocardia sp.]|nr:glutamate--cysteine ligase [Pseudonocardia sp.]
MTSEPSAFRYGIEHEAALLRSDGTFADFTNTTFAELAAIVDELPEDPADWQDLRIGDVGIKRKRWYIEGYERFDEHGRLLRCDPKGLEIRTRIHDDIDTAVAALRADQERLDEVAARHDLQVIAVGFNPVRSEYRVRPTFNSWERMHRLGSPEERTAHLHMTTYGPDLNLSWQGSTSPDLVEAACKLTHLSPYLVPLSFSSPFRDGAPWGGLSARTFVRTGPRPSVLAFLTEGEPQVPSDPSLTQPARLAAEVGRLEFKAFDACPDPQLYGELLALLTGLVRDATLRGRRATPDAALHRRAAQVGYADPALRVGAEAALDAAPAAVGDRPADAARLASLRARFDRRECPATAMLERYAAGHPVAGLHPRR